MRKSLLMMALWAVLPSAGAVLSAEEATQGPTKQEIEALYERGKLLYAQGRLDGAREAFERVLKEDPGFIETEPLRKEAGLYLDRIAEGGRGTAPVSSSRGAVGDGGAGGGAEEALEAARRQKQLRTEHDRVVADHHFQAGMHHLGKLEYGLARDEFEKAAELGHPEAPEQLRKVSGLLGGTPDRYGIYLEKLRDERRAEIEQRTFEIKQGFRRAEEEHARENHAEAIRTLELLRDQIRFLPLEVPGRQGWLSGVEEQLAAYRKDHQAYEAKLVEERDRAIQDRVRTEEERRVQAFQGKIDRLMEDAFDAYERKEFGLAKELSEHVLKEEPGNETAHRLSRLAAREQTLARREAIAKEASEGWEALKDSSREQLVPYDVFEPLHFPGNWQQIRESRGTDGGYSEQKEPWRRVLEDALQTTKDVTFPGTTFDRVVEYLGTMYGSVPIKVDRKVMDQVGTTEIYLQGKVTLERALNWLMDEVNGVADPDLYWTLKEGRIWISDEEGVRGNPVYNTYDVRDLVVSLSDFTAPEISLAGEEGVSLGVTEVAQEASFTIEDLQELIEDQVTVPGGWNTAQAQIKAMQGGQLIIRATAEVHGQIHQLLAGFRGQKQLLVSMQARFIQLSDTLLDDIGVSWNGLGVRPVTVGARQNSPGILNEPGGVNDLRIFVPNQSNMAGDPFTFNPNAMTSLQGDANNPGAYSFLQYSFLSNWQVQMLMRAVHATRKGSILFAPSLTCFNTQRANMMVLQQQAYVKDYTRVSSGNSTGFDPEIGYIQEGVVFDVRPVVSADRKFITLELRPSVARLLSMPTFDIGGADIQTPTLQLKSFRTTVTLPDEGTLLIGGLTEFNENHQYTGVPFLSKIPFLNFLFGRDTDVSERQNLVVIVRAQIIDHKELEQRMFGQ
jgi:Flp pilus assembly secretin CpaC/tetratricopeptide (TPR) repeat protein